MFKFLLKAFGQILDWLKQSRNLVTIITLSIMFILFTTLWIIMLVEKKELLRDSDDFTFTYSLVWNIAISTISAFSVLLLFELPKFENAFCSNHRNYKGYVRFSYEIIYNWYFKVMFAIGMVLGFSHAAISGFISRFSPITEMAKITSTYNEYWIYIIFIWLIPTLTLIILNFINFRGHVLITRSLLMILLGLGYLAIGWFVASIIVMIVLFYIALLFLRIIFLFIASIPDNSRRDWEIRELTEELRKLRQGW